MDIKYSPWGPVDHCENIGPGIWSVSTPSHGGIKLDRKRNAAIPKDFRQAGGWYEEDCDWAIPAFFFPLYYFAERSILSDGRSRTDSIISTLINWHPHEYARYCGVPVESFRGISLKYDDEMYEIENAHKWCVISACGDWHKDVPKGFVGITATLGGKRSVYGQTPVEERFFLVPAERYNTRYVCDGSEAVWNRAA